MRGNSHFRFGGRAEETDPPKGRHRASARSNHLAGTLAAPTGASTKELMHRLGHASPRAALRCQHATAERDEAIANGIDRILEVSQNDGDQDTNVLRFRRTAE